MIDGLYLITAQEPVETMLGKVAAALLGGARVVQYRDKVRPDQEQLVIANQLKHLCRQRGATFIVNDDPVIAQASGADGVHIGQQDGGISEARRILGQNKIIGVSTRNAEEALKAQMQGADYVAVGSIYPTSSKDDIQVVGLDMLKKVRKAVQVPVVAIGGINCDNGNDVLKAGADALCVISAVMADPAPELAAGEMALLFNHRNPFPRGKVLTIAGSDSGGGAGIQADLKTITLLGSFGMSAITALTAQNTLGVKGVHPAPVDFVTAQIEAVLADLGTDTVKTGMLFSAEIVEEVARAIRVHALLAVVDPVMIAKGGAPLLQQEAIAAFLKHLLPVSYLLTPNLPETEALTGLAVRNEKDMERAARRLQQMGARNVLIKGGHLEGAAVDLLLADDQLHRFAAPRLSTPNTHGTGCTYSAAIATFLAQGVPLIQAVEQAKTFITEAIRSTFDLGTGHGPVNHYRAAQLFHQPE
ncbi:bifunctional hydroxymethylpyrimidine kinase/phosphomethylpyrimidine kinase [Desulfuromonas sp. AOP6]|uniref:bifunctional hydroxymethylpyrimidine kinase/phosphomethylpyrimidine kinase n=1 Tax=Desulfuromonas sp. AOP6 TaxID=1566351 RepID=UPI00126E581A|nr:bifunctional hydroxymethylpyrimidine kinase/phosphomethylpyrimidine kinase [Desulfuromonas sp. AOP6]BCA80562.1 thiamine biosynthesis bifunctional protein ThiED [Desulfuromonas sp. AOP6]